MAYACQRERRAAGVDRVGAGNERTSASLASDGFASSALDFTATVDGGNGKNDINFKLNADPNDMLGVSTAYGSIYQPKGEEVDLDGFLHSDEKGIQLSRTHLSVGKSTLEVSGSIVYSRAAPVHNTQLQPIDLTDSEVDFHVATIKPMPVPLN